MVDSRAFTRLRNGTFGLVLLALAGASALGIAAPPPPASTSFDVSASELYDGLEQAFTKVPEFQFIRQEAKRLGVRVYLFGGTASGLAHYVKWDIQRKKGDARLQKERFDYDMTNIYRSTQDLDLVVDGTEEQAQDLQRKLAVKFPYLQGSKEAWEVRLLRNDSGPKEALLDNPSFLNQHTDSNSTGLILVSERAAREPPSRIVRDLRQWKSTKPEFLQDVLQGKLHYYYSAKHESTQRARQGMNPPILSAIRYLTKAFQYELEILPEDEAKIRKVISDFKPSDIQKLHPYVASWIEKNGRKLYMHAVSLDYARQKLEGLGLRKKLLALPGDADEIDSLAWWLNRRPLPEFAVGKGRGATAAQLALTRVAHETKDFIAYESITRSHTGAPNVFESRAGATGELAVHGDGFYTAIGNQGARGTQFTIRFDVDPRAREGKDFTVVKDKSYVIFHNKAALRVVPESLDLKPSDYFRMLSEGHDLDRSNRGVLEKFRRKLETRLSVLTADEAREIREIVRSSVAPFSVHAKKKDIEAVSAKTAVVLNAWFRLPHRFQDPETLRLIQEGLIARVRALSGLPTLSQIATNLLEIPEVAQMKELVGTLVAANDPNTDIIVAEHVLAGNALSTNAEAIRAILKHRSNSRDWLLAKYVFSRPESVEMTEEFETLLRTDRAETLKEIIREVFSQPHSRAWIAQLKSLIPRLNRTVLTVAAEHVFSKPHAHDLEPLIQEVIRRGDATVHSHLAEYAFSQPHTAEMTKSIQLLIETKAPPILHSLAEHVFSQPHTAHMSILINQMIEGADRHTLQLLARHTFSQPHTASMFSTMRLWLEKADLLTLPYFHSFVLIEQHTLVKQFDVLERAADIRDPDQRRAFLAKRLGEYKAQDVPSRCVGRKLRQPL